MRIKAELKTNRPDYAVFLRELRKSEHKTLKDVAKHIGITFMAMSHYENGIRHPNLDRFSRWLDYFGLEMTVDRKKILK